MTELNRNVPYCFTDLQQRHREMKKQLLDIAEALENCIVPRIDPRPSAVLIPPTEEESEVIRLAQKLRSLGYSQ